MREVVVLRPDPWFLRGVYLDSSAYGAPIVIARPNLMPLFTGVRGFHDPLGLTLRMPPAASWPTEDFDRDEDLISYVQSTIEPWLDRYGSPRAVAEDVMRGRYQRDPYALEVAHAGFILDRDLASASRALKAFHEQLAFPGWGDDLLADFRRVDELHALAETSLELAVARLSDTRAERLKELRLPESVLG